jgi:hypothetical protein
MALIGLAALFVLVLVLVRRGLRSTRSFVEKIDDNNSPRLGGDETRPTVNSAD